jgi:GNAT superfamily N-acetyltransferase
MMQQLPGPDRATKAVGPPARPEVRPRIRPARPGDDALLEQLLAWLSPDSAHQRFLTGTAGGPSPRLVAALLPEPPAGRALLAFVGAELVGHALWVRLADPAAAEIAIVVADDHQRCGVGTALAGAVVDDLVAHGVRDVEVFSISDNRAVARMVARAAPAARRQLDGPTTTWSFPARSRVAALPRTA